MDIQRIRSEVVAATRTFPNVEVYPTADGGIYVKAMLQSAVGIVYFPSIYFAGYPATMPRVYISKPELAASPHRYREGNICYLHPNMWNPGRHDLTFVLGRTAKWLNKYEVWRATGRWVGAQLQH